MNNHNEKTEEEFKKEFAKLKEEFKTATEKEKKEIRKKMWALVNQTEVPNYSLRL